jgi:hypothetical protein
MIVRCANRQVHFLAACTGEPATDLREAFVSLVQPPLIKSLFLHAACRIVHDGKDVIEIPRARAADKDALVKKNLLAG